MEFVHRPECDELRETVEGGESFVHLGGGPGIGKSRTLEWLESALEDNYDTRFLQLYATHDFGSLVDDIHRELYESMPLQQRLKYRLSDVSGLWFSSFGVEFDAHSDPIEELETIAELLPNDREIVVCLDDVHKLAKEKRDIREYIKRIVDSLPGNVTLVSAGRVHFGERSEAAIEMRPLPKERVEKLLASTAGVDERTVKRLYEQTDGYPYYLTLLSESDQTVSADGGIPELPKDEFRRYIEQNYLESLKRNEERFLRGTVPLVDLDEHICSLAIPDTTRTEARRMLSTLRTRCIVREAEGDDAAPRRYQLHDKFREFLCELERTDPTVEQLFEQLTDASVEDRRRITDALAEIAADNPAYLEGFLDRIVEPLNDNDGQVRSNASVVVARLAAENPEQVDSAALSKMIELIETDDHHFQRAVVQQLVVLAKINPQALEPHIDQLQTIVERRDKQYPPEFFTFVAYLSEQYPDRMRPLILQLKQKIKEHTTSVHALEILHEQYETLDYSQYLRAQAQISDWDSDQIADVNRDETATRFPTLGWPQDTDLTFTEEVEPLDMSGSQHAEVLKVWYQTDEGSNQAVLKQLLTDNEAFRRQFESQVKLWSQIDDHKNVVTLIESGTQPNRWFLMDYLDGGSLADYLNREPNSTQRNFDMIAAESILDDIFSAIGYAHENDIVHGDLTPLNVLFAGGQGWSPQISDWGQARQLPGVSEATMIYSPEAPSVEGVNLPYAAPEMVDPDAFGEIDKRTDIYQLAMVSYELYTGRRPFTSSSPAALMREHLQEQPPPPSEVSDAVPPELDSVFEKALAKDKSDRYQTVEELQAVLLS